MILFHLTFFWSICVSVVFDDVVLREVAGTLYKVTTHRPLVNWRWEGGGGGEEEQDGKQQGPHGRLPHTDYDYDYDYEIGDYNSTV